VQVLVLVRVLVPDVRIHSGRSHERRPGVDVMISILCDFR
jgi:hypothetical protein